MCLCEPLSKYDKAIKKDEEMNKVILTIIRKEFLHISKDRQTLFIVLIWPVLMLIFFGYAITMEMRSIPTIISDQSKSYQSRELISKFSSSGFFKIKNQDISAKEVDTLFKHREAKCILIIPPDYCKKTQTTKTTIALLIDASDPTAAINIQNYVNNILAKYNREINPNLKMPLTISLRFLYNDNLKSSYFFVPGLAAVIMLLISTLLTSIAIVKEKEQGTMEQILVSPIRPIEIVLGKVVPYIIVAFTSGVIVILAAMFWFGVPMHGSFLLALAMMFLYVVTGASLGMLISSIANTQQIALLVSLIGTLLPTTLLSGFIFPISSMPLFFQYISKIIPASHFVVIIRGIMLKGVGVKELAGHIVALSAISLILLVVSIKKIKVNLE